jgi:hypothetical protein
MRLLILTTALLGAILLSFTVAAPGAQAASRPGVWEVPNWNGAFRTVLADWHVIADDTTGSQFYKATYLRCYTDARWRQMSAGQPGLMGFYRPGSAWVNASQTTCTNGLHALIGQMSATNIVALSTLIHESMHRQGIRNEASAECLGDIGVFEALRANRNISQGQAARASAIALRW